jgi:hypothetical protein
MAGDFLAAKETFATELDGVPIVVHRKELVRSGHPLIDANPEKFEPAERATRFDVEQATAAPGEKRGGRPRRVGRTGTPTDPRGISDDKDSNYFKEQ